MLEESTKEIVVKAKDRLGHSTHDVVKLKRTKEFFDVSVVAFIFFERCKKEKPVIDRIDVLPFRKKNYNIRELQ